ncbi:MAG: hypothetical protein IPH34_09555 [Chitinophagaceae bacterium]|nr:hypothetical protein [Chitinophagaceae bacterium]MBK8607169.1 hypothetical protein [Chitinophagaceae bacterium]MBP6476845.1 hypothetical protein [Chitinophagaceae bacterium]MBP7108183.1 hypothetical protein [Chitinophagaceae bacterium]MBP7315553.1 hypothetical protein [Chitinophagaceae bacterium]
MIIRKTILFLFSMILAQTIIAQGDASIKASVNKNKILLGEPLVLTIESYFPSGSKIQFEQIDTIAHFEFLDKPVIDSSSENGDIKVIGKYTITSFDSGHWVIPSFTLAKGVKTDTIPIDVVFSDFNPEQDYHDIKDIIEVKTKKEGIPWWIYATAVAFLLLTVIFLARRKKKPVVIAKEKIVVNPYEEAMQQLTDLQKENPDTKTYYAELTNIFRLYIFRKKGILSLQKTTDDLILQVKDVVNDKGKFDKLSQALRLSDFVKFAKYIPEEGDKQTSYSDILNSIKLIEGSGT